MSWSYNPETLKDDKKDQVRLKLGDTDESDALLQDEEILFLLEQSNDNVLKASVQGCLLIISKLSGLVDFKVGPYSESQGDRLKSYQLLYSMLSSQAAIACAPLAKTPTTGAVFHYDMMSIGGCEHE